LLNKCLRTYTPSQFSKHRIMILRIGLLCLDDFFSLPSVFLTYITIYRISDLKILIQIRKNESVKKILNGELGSEFHAINTKSVDIEQQKFESPPLSAAPQSKSESPAKALPDNLNGDLHPVSPIEDQKKIESSPSTPPVVQKNKPLTAQEIIENETDILLLIMSRRCGVLIVLDLLSLPFMALTLTHPASIKFYLGATKENIQKKNSCKTVDKYYGALLQETFIRFKGGFFALSSHLATLGILTLLFFLLWRIPTFCIVLTNQEMREFLLKDIVPQEKKREVIAQSRSKTFGVIVLYCLGQLLKDLLVSPFFFILFTIVPWRSWLVIKQFYQYNCSCSISIQLKTQRKLIRKQVKLGLSDVYCALKLIIITITLIRIPFLVMIILKNRFPSKKIAETKAPLGVKFQSKRSHSGGVESKSTLGTNNEVIAVTKIVVEIPQKAPVVPAVAVPSTKLSFKKCVRITFIELLKDLVMLPFGLLLIIIAPWRIFEAYSIYRSQIDRIPTYYNEKRVIPSRRRDIFDQLGSVFTVDFIGLLELIILVFSIYKIPAVCLIIFNYFKNLNNEEQYFSFKKSLDIEFNKLMTVTIKALAIITIIILFLRIPKAFKRLQRYQKKQTAQKKAQIKQKKLEARVPQENQQTLNDIKWDTYGVMCQFLTVQDLAHLSQVNKKFYALNQKDFYWEYQYKRDYAGHKGQIENHTFKEKCVAAYVSKKVYVPEQPLTQEKRDDLYGVMYILYDEAIKSIKWAPHILLLPVKLLTLALAGFFRLFFCKKDFPYFAIRCPTNFVDKFRQKFAGHAFIDAFKFDTLDLKSFKKLHLQLPIFVSSVLVAYVCEIGYFLSYLNWIFVKLLSAGQTHPFTIQYNPFLNIQFNQNPDPPTAEYPIRALRYPLYLLQLVFFLFNALFWAISLAALPFIFCYYLEFEWYEGIFGPCFVFLPHYAMMLNSIATHCQYTGNGAPYFQPWKSVTEIGVLVGFLCKKSWEHVGKPLFDKIGDGITFIAKLLWKGLKAFCKRMEKIAKAIYKACKLVLKNLILGYAKILTFFTRMSLKCGCVGDLLLIPFALAWMFWPLVIPVILEAYIYFIPCGIVGVILMVYGYKVIKKASNQA